jgi:hypothetical protein
VSVLLTLTHNNEHIQFHNDKLGTVGNTTYKPEIWSELNKVTWRVNEEKFKEKEKTYIYTGSTKLGHRKELHQVVMRLWYGDEDFEVAYQDKYIIEHHNNDAFDCRIENMSFASKDLNLAKAHTFDKNQPQLVMRVAVNFYKDFDSKQYQITIFFTDNYKLLMDGNSVYIERLYLVYSNNFRLVYTDANRVVDELLENSEILFRLLSPEKISYKEALFYVRNDGEEVSGLNWITDESGQMIVVVGNDSKGKMFIQSIPPKKDLY